MKLLKTYLLLSVLLLAGCMKDETDDCPYNAMLTFRYNGDQTQDIFAQKIDGVTMYVFSADGQLVTTKVLSQSELRAYQGVNLKLDPGQYRFVCWGNAFAATKFTDEHNFAAARLQHPNLIGGMDIPTNDHLYFGTYELNLPKNDILAGEILFASAHINLEIYTKGTAGLPAQLPPVEVQNLYPQYDFAMMPAGSQVVYHPLVTYDAEKQSAATLLQVLRFGDDNPIIIDIKDPSDGHSITRLNLKDFMADNNIRVDGIHEATVRILVEYGDLGVHITIPDWEQGDLDPEGPGYN